MDAESCGRLASLVKRVNENRIQIIIDRLVGFTASKDEGVRDIASLGMSIIHSLRISLMTTNKGLKTVVAEIAPGTALAKTACVKLAPKVVAQLESTISSAELLIDSLDLLSDLLSRFESTVKTIDSLQASVLKATTPLLSNSRIAVRKRAVATLGAAHSFFSCCSATDLILCKAILVGSSDIALFNTLTTSTILVWLKAADKEHLKTAILLIGSLARFARFRRA